MNRLRPSALLLSLVLAVSLPGCSKPTGAQANNGSRPRFCRQGRKSGHHRAMKNLLALIAPITLPPACCWVSFTSTPVMPIRGNRTEKSHRQQRRSWPAAMQCKPEARAQTGHKVLAALDPSACPDNRMRHSCCRRRRRLWCSPADRASRTVVQNCAAAGPSSR